MCFGWRVVLRWRTPASQLSLQQAPQVRAFVRANPAAGGAGAQNEIELPPPVEMPDPAAESGE
jgi:hypothetical protein